MFRIRLGSDGERKLEWDGRGVGWPISFSWETDTGGAKTLRSRGGWARERDPSFTLRVLGFIEIAV